MKTIIDFNRLFSYLRHSWKIWILFFGIPALILFITTKKSYSNNATVFGFLFQCLTTGYIAWAIQYTYSTLYKKEKVFTELMQAEQNLSDWYRSEINNIYKGPYAYSIFLVTAILLFLTPVSLIGNPLPRNSAVQFYITFGILSCVMGVGASTVFLIARFMARYAKCTLNFSIFQYNHSNLQFVVKLQLIFAGITSLGYLLAAFMTFFYWGFQTVTIIWYLAGIASVLFFFIYPQLEFHKLLQARKKEKLLEISREMDRFFKKLISEPSEPNFKLFREMHETASFLSKLPEWPFNAQSLIYLILSILPHAIFLIKTFIG
ncbi:MAG: hypothetical protein AUJ60_09245 [Nitrospirae bacterium CG1_02_44_142]|nr:MAG: hypothetical protein AUJ60_09245 [Nitrospirae bacterium CG1_02_44_142]